MWKAVFKETFKFLFDNPAVFVTLLGNYALLFLFGPVVGVVALWFISVLYLAGLHSDNLWEGIKRYLKWGFIVAVILYLLLFAEGLLSFYLFSYLFYGLKLPYQWLLLLAVPWALILALVTHGIYIPLFASQDFNSFKRNLRFVKVLYLSGWGIKTFLLLWAYLTLTLWAGLLKFLHFTVGLYAVITTFWLTYYTFLGVKFFKKETLKEV
jgi:hypothetical protein